MQKNEPEPDGALVRGTPSNYSAVHPNVSDILCIFEVSDSSLHFDRTTKQRIYAEAGIPTYVIVNLIDRAIELRTQPTLGQYASLRTLRAGQGLPLSLGSADALEIPVDQLLP